MRRVNEVAAIVLYLLVLDGAVETLLSGSPIRWVLLAVVGATGTAGVVLLRRAQRNIQIWVSGLALLTMVTLSSWLPGGMTSGVRLLGQGTSTVLGVVSALGVAFAGLILLRDRNLPARLRLAAAILAAYGGASFVLGVAGGTPFPDLFHGRAFWDRLPSWLQGAVLGSVLVIPASIVSALHAYLRRRGALSARSLAAHVTALGLCAAVAVAGLRAPAGVTVRGSTPARQTEELERHARAVAAALEALPRDSFDPGAVVAATGSDPAALLAWVRDHTLLVPYRGALRGPVGVLLDRRGNSLDRALLLHAMLQLAGHKVHLAHGTMSADRAARVLASIPPGLPRGTDGRGRAPSGEQLLDDYARRFDLDRAYLGALAARMRHAREQFSREQAERIQEQARGLAETLGLREGSGHDDQAEQVAAIQDHWWVQWQNGTQWVDLDPTLPRTPAEGPLAAPAETVSLHTLSDLPTQLKHTVEIRLIVEFWQNGRRSETTVLAESIPAAEAVGETVTIRHVPVDWPQTLEGAGGRDAVGALTAEVLNRRAWTPILTLGRKDVVGDTFHDDGRISRGAGTGAANPGSVVERMLSGDRGPRNDAAPPAGTVGAEGSILTAEWIEYELRSPGRSARRIRRELFDLIGPASRSTASTPALSLTPALRLERGWALLGETEVLIQVSHLSPEFIADVMARRFLAAQEAARRLLGDGSRSGLLGEATTLSFLPTRLYSLALARREAAPSAEEVYLDRPNVLSWHSWVRDGGRGTLLLGRAFDVVANEVAVRPGERRGAVLLRVAQGVADTSAEALLFSPANRGDNISEIHARLDRRHRWAAIRSIDDPAWRRIKVDRDVRWRIEEDLRAGYVVLVPDARGGTTDRSAVGWWRVDPRTGDTLGIGRRGWGQTASEQPMITTTIVRKLIHTVSIIAALKCIYTHSPTPGMGGPSLTPDLSLDFAAGIDMDYARRSGYPTPSDADLANREGAALLGWIAVCAFIGGVAIWTLSGTMVQLIAQLIAGGISFVI